MKKQIVLAAMLAMYSASAQEKVRDESNSLWEHLGKKAYNVLEKTVQTGSEYAQRKLYEADLESQIEQKLSYKIPDKTSADLVSFLGLRQSVSADISSFTDSTASAQVCFGYNLDGLEFVNDYEFSLSNEKIGNIKSKSEQRIKLNGKEYSQAEGTRFLHLYSLVARQWEQTKQQHKKENPQEDFSYERKYVFLDGNYAKIETDYHITDKFGKPKQGKLQKVTQEYVFENSAWKFHDTSFFSSEKNPVEAEKGLVRTLKDAYKSASSEIKKWWEGK